MIVIDDSPSSPAAAPASGPLCGGKSSSQQRDEEDEAWIQSGGSRCPICFLALFKDVAALMGCGHTFHLACIERWFTQRGGRSQKPTCPYCAKEYASRRYILSLHFDIPDPSSRLSALRAASGSAPEDVETKVRRLELELEVAKREKFAATEEATGRAAALEALEAREEELVRLLKAEEETREKLAERVEVLEEARTREQEARENAVRTYDENRRVLEEKYQQLSKKYHALQLLAAVVKEERLEGATLLDKIRKLPGLSADEKLARLMPLVEFLKRLKAARGEELKKLKKENLLLRRRLHALVLGDAAECRREKTAAAGAATRLPSNREQRHEERDISLSSSSSSSSSSPSSSSSSSSLASTRQACETLEKAGRSESAPPGSSSGLRFRRDGGGGGGRTEGCRSFASSSSSASTLSPCGRSLGGSRGACEVAFSGSSQRETEGALGDTRWARPQTGLEAADLALAEGERAWDRERRRKERKGGGSERKERPNPAEVGGAQAAARRRAGREYDSSSAPLGGSRGETSRGRGGGGDNACGDSEVLWRKRRRGAYSERRQGSSGLKRQPRSAELCARERGSGEAFADQNGALSLHHWEPCELGAHPPFAAELSSSAFLEEREGRGERRGRNESGRREESETHALAAGGTDEEEEGGWRARRGRRHARGGFGSDFAEACTQREQDEEAATQLDSEVGSLLDGPYRLDGALEGSLLLAGGARQAAKSSTRSGGFSSASSPSPAVPSALFPSRAWGSAASPLSSSSAASLLNRRTASPAGRVPDRLDASSEQLWRADDFLTSSPMRGGATSAHLPVPSFIAHFLNSPSSSHERQRARATDGGEKENRPTASGGELAAFFGRSPVSDARLQPQDARSERQTAFERADLSACGFASRENSQQVSVDPAPAYDVGGTAAERPADGTRRRQARGELGAEENSPPRSKGRCGETRVSCGSPAATPETREKQSRCRRASSSSSPEVLCAADASSGCEKTREARSPTGSRGVGTLEDGHQAKEVPAPSGVRTRGGGRAKQSAALAGETDELRCAGLSSARTQREGGGERVGEEKIVSAESDAETLRGTGSEESEASSDESQENDDAPAIALGRSEEKRKWGSLQPYRPESSKATMTTKGSSLRLRRRKPSKTSRGKSFMEKKSDEARGASAGAAAKPRFASIQRRHLHQGKAGTVLGSLLIRGTFSSRGGITFAVQNSVEKRVLN